MNKGKVKEKVATEGITKKLSSLHGTTEKIPKGSLRNRQSEAIST